jgi:hypothetical protein
MSLGSTPSVEPSDFLAMYLEFIVANYWFLRRAFLIFAAHCRFRDSCCPQVDRYVQGKLLR